MCVCLDCVCVSVCCMCVCVFVSVCVSVCECVFGLCCMFECVLYVCVFSLWDVDAPDFSQYPGQLALVAGRCRIIKRLP